MSAITEASQEASVGPVKLAEDLPVGHTARGLEPSSHGEFISLPLAAGIDSDCEEHLKPTIITTDSRLYRNRAGIIGLSIAPPPPEQSGNASVWRSDCTGPSPKRKLDFFEADDNIAEQIMTMAESRNRTQKAEQRYWGDLDVQFRRHDQRLVKAWKESMDTLLVFAGLFSGVVTAFNVQYFVTLVGGASWGTSSATFNVADVTRCTRTDGTLPLSFLATLQTIAYQPSDSAVIINSLWFSSLVYSLIAASLATLVKQWVHHYGAEIHAPPRERTRIREHRFNGVRAWCLPEIVAFLPLLLRAALTLFLLGVIIFLKTLNSFVMWVVTVPIIIWLAAYSASIVLPVFFFNCPYKSPESSILYLLSRIALEGVRPSLRRIHLIAWKDREHRLRKRSSLDISMLVTADLTFADEILATTVRQCASELDDWAMIEVIRRILCHRLHLAGDIFRPSDRNAEISKYMTLTGKCVSAVMDIIMDTLGREVNQQIGPEGIKETTVLNFAGPIGSCINYILIILQYSKDIDDTTFDERLLQLTKELLIPQRTFSNMSLQTVRILQSRPSLYISGLATKVFLRELYRLTKAAWSTVWSGRTTAVIPLCAVILQLWRHMPQDVLRNCTDDVEDVLSNMADYIEDTNATRDAHFNVISPEHVDECLQTLSRLEDPRSVGIQACRSLKIALQRVKDGVRDASIKSKSKSNSWPFRDFEKLV